MDVTLTSKSLDIGLHRHIDTSVWEGRLRADRGAFPLRTILISMGSLGDMLPFVYLGRALADRGHEVLLLGCEEYKSKVQDPRIEFHPIMSAEVYRQNLQSRQCARGQSQPIIDFFRWACDQIEPIYELLAERFDPGQTVVCAQSAAIGARVAQEQLGIPLATAHLQPLWMRSSFDMPPMPRWMSRCVGRTIHGIVDFFVDQTFRRDVQQACRPLGVKVGNGMIRRWWNSPERILGFWPDWFSPPQRDWPPKALLAGFPMPNEMDPAFDQGPLNTFLSAGDAPIVFTHGSNDPHARPFFETSIQIAKKLRRRAVLLCPVSPSVPDYLPDGVVCFPYVPLDRLLPRAAAHVHHGGVGTIALSLRAGVPQIAVPSAFDQPDNSQRLARLGVAHVIKPKNYQTDRVASRLSTLMASSDVRSRCQDYAARLQGVEPFQIACDALEDLAMCKSAPSVRRRSIARPKSKLFARGGNAARSPYP